MMLATDFGTTLGGLYGLGDGAMTLVESALWSAWREMMKEVNAQGQS